MQRRTRRLIFFAIAILVGIATGVVYGWVVNPVDYTDTGPHTLRIDYKTDYALMVAELYHVEGDVVMAMARLTYLGDDVPVELMDAAIPYAEAHDYAPGDLQLMRELAQAITLALPEGE